LFMPDGGQVYLKKMFERIMPIAKESIHNNVNIYHGDIGEIL